VFKVDLGDSAELRPLEPWMAEEFLAHMDRARAFVDPWIPWASVSTDLESARATLQRYADKQAQVGAGVYGIWLGGTLVGGVMFPNFDPARDTGEVGCWLEPSATGHGLITRAIRVLIDYALVTRGLHRVEWRCRPDNTASSNVARRLGMTLDGTLREQFPFNGVHYDCEVWSILAREWKPTPP
jgi:ribosomal-protein-serine acetyltransferase